VSPLVGGMGGVEPTGLVFGPVPSRRLGRSLGVNNIPPKVCSYSCVYCQVGPTVERTIEPRLFHPPAFIADQVRLRLERLKAAGEPIDYVTFVPDGEPTLDLGLGEAIDSIRALGVRVAVISNGSLLWRGEVREALGRADWVSVKVDAVDPVLWHRIDRPHPDLSLSAVLDGISSFAAEYRGRLVSETMLVEGLNDVPEAVAGIGPFLRRLGLSMSYLAIPTRPTPSPQVGPPGEEAVNRVFQALAEHVPNLEYLIGYEGDRFSSTGDPRADLLAITAVHPMRESAVIALLEGCGADRDVVERLIAEGTLVETPYRGARFYLRRWRDRPGPSRATSQL
jgi:wyosine [tRNA(Phe)-imidazoG37] synthetase (radical SAM superfamily)